MISFNRILVPVDFSEPSRKAVTYGLTLAAQLNAKLFIAHVVPSSTVLNYTFPAETYEIEKQKYEDATKEIRDLAPARYAAKFDVETIVKTGGIEKELLGIIHRKSVDLVIMGTHGRRYPGRWFIGSVTEHLLRTVPIPVLTVSHLGPEDHSIELGLVSLKQILYATDLSDSLGIGMQYAIELARRTGAQLTAMHVVDHAKFVLVSDSTKAYLEAARVKLMGEMRSRLDDLVLREKPADVAVETLVVGGRPYEKILEVAEQRSMDIIILNLHSKGVLERAFLGSTAERVVRLARVPVLSIPIAPAKTRSEDRTIS
jgi:nucleotide-binding universal stress UspA family protein